MSATIQLKGGLGNQLFQIFGTLGICKLNDYQFYLDKSMVRSSIKHLLKSLVEELHSKFLERPVDVEIASIQQQRFSQYSLVKLQTSEVPHVIFNAYFQSFYFFEHCRDLVFDHLINKQDSQLMNQVDTLHQSIVSQFPNKQLVFVHRRKGDYADPIHNGYFAILSMDYYQKAFEKFNQENTCFVIFSEDQDDTKQEFDQHFPNLTKFYVEYLHDYIELLLMSKMDGAIIANSTFSSWGAYLMDYHRTKTIVAPKYWFAEWNIHRLDFLESHWTLIENNEVYQHVTVDPKRK